MVRWYELNGLGCPVTGCRGQNKSYDWICNACRTPMYMSDTGYLKCRDGTHCEQIIKWKFNCGNHGNHPVNSFQHADFQGFSFALSHAVQFLGDVGATWVAALCMELGKQFGRL